ncbi:MAG: hypothetical protein P0S94_05255, partial [Simkaniaceae bacterium]|nr:hypothetical protein [Simkaniaceae bacterium]
MNTFTYYSPAVAPLLTDVLWYALEEREQSSYHFSLKMAELPMLSDEAVKKWNWEAREITAEVRAIDWLLQLYNEDINEYLLSEQLKEDGLIDVICKCIGREYIKKELCNHPRLLLDMTHHYRNVIPLEMIRALQTQKQWTYVCNEPGAIEGFYSYKLTSEALCLTYNTLQRNSLVPENDFHHGIQTWVARECSIQQNRFKLSQKKEFPGFVRDVSLDKSTCIEFIKIFFVSHRTFLISHSQYVDFTEADRFDVAMTLLHFAPGRVVYNIRDFDLSEQNRYFLAINLAAIKDTDIMYRLQDFKITNRSDRFTIAKIAAKTN